MLYFLSFSFAVSGYLGFQLQHLTLGEEALQSCVQLLHVSCVQGLQKKGQADIMIVTSRQSQGLKNKGQPDIMIA